MEWLYGRMVGMALVASDLVEMNGKKVECGKVVKMGAKYRCYMGSGGVGGSALAFGIIDGIILINDGHVGIR